MIDDNKHTLDHKDERDVKLLLEVNENHHRDPFAFDVSDLCI